MGLHGLAWFIIIRLLEKIGGASQVCKDGVTYWSAACTMPCMDYKKLIVHAQQRRDALLQQVQLLEKLIEISTILDRDEPVPQKMLHDWLDSSLSPTRREAAAVLNSLGRPVKTAELLPLLRQRGVSIEGKNPLATLSARMSNSRDFQSLGPLGWWFRDRDIPGSSSATSDSPLAQLLQKRLLTEEGNNPGGNDVEKS